MYRKAGPNNYKYLPFRKQLEGASGVFQNQGNYTKNISIII